MTSKLFELIWRSTRVALQLLLLHMILNTTAYLTSPAPCDLRLGQEEIWMHTDEQPQTTSPNNQDQPKCWTVSKQIPDIASKRTANMLPPPQQTHALNNITVFTIALLILDDEDISSSRVTISVSPVLVVCNCFLSSESIESQAHNAHKRAYRPEQHCHINQSSFLNHQRRLSYLQQHSCQKPCSSIRTLHRPMSPSAWQTWSRRAPQELDQSFIVSTHTR